MDVRLFTILVWIGEVAAGLLGALTGLGGGVVIVPLLTLVCEVDVRCAPGASLISVIITSSGAASAYVREGYSSMSGLLGIGSGALKVPVMDMILGLPFRISMTLSNFMTGVTAAASAGNYVDNGYVAPAPGIEMIYNGCTGGCQ